MNFKDAIDILEIDLNYTKYNEITLEYLKKQFRKLALKNHPDKNGNTMESKESFQKINEAYNFLKKEIKHFKPNEVDKVDELDEVSSSLYYDILQSFIKPFFEEKYDEILSKIVNDIITTGKKYQLKYLTI
jgi:curved DNA-binding protein CbpA